MMFFFSFDTEDLKSELEDFVADPKLVKVVERALRQRNDFIERFPLETLGTLSDDQLWSTEQRDDSFIYWITDKTRDVTNRLPWAKFKLGLGSSLFRANEWRQKLRILRDGGKDELVSFLSGDEFYPAHRLERCLGKPLLLKLLYLYFPDKYSNIATVDWIERITSYFALSYGDDIYVRSRGVRQFYSNNAQHNNGRGLDYLKDFFVEYIGLRGETKQFSAHLTQCKGFSLDVVDKYSLRLRQVSRLLEGFGITSKSIFKIHPRQFIDISGQLIERLQSAVATDAGNRVVLKKVDDFSVAIDQYVEFLKSQMVDEKSIIETDVLPHKVAGARRVEHNETTPQGKKNNNWAREMGQATNSHDVVATLQRSGSERPFYRHYTTLSSFLFISDDWMFRLTRGDDPSMNDKLEWKLLGDEQLWTRTFIASFSCVEGESAAMWGLYGKPSNEALRLSFDSALMKQWVKSLREHDGDERTPIVQFFGAKGEPGEKCKLEWKDVDVVFGDILYGGNISGKGDAGTRYIFRRKELPRKVFARFGEKFERTAEITGFIKSADWAYEDEARLIVRVHKDACLPIGRNVSDIKHVFVPVGKEIMAKVEYMKGPSVSAKLRPMIEEKLKSIFPVAFISDSRYKDNLKFR